MRTVNSADTVWTEQDYADARADVRAVEVEQLLQNMIYNQRKAAQESRKEYIKDCFKAVLWVLAVVIFACAVKGIWWPLQYATMPITVPLFLGYMLFNSVADLITPAVIVTGLLVAILIKLEKK